MKSFRPAPEMLKVLRVSVPWGPADGVGSRSQPTFLPVQESSISLSPTTLLSPIHATFVAVCGFSIDPARPTRCSLSPRVGHHGPSRAVFLALITWCGLVALGPVAFAAQPPVVAQAPDAPFRQAEAGVPARLALWEATLPTDPATDADFSAGDCRASLAALDERLFVTRTLGPTGTLDDGLRKVELLAAVRKKVAGRLAELLSARHGRVVHAALPPVEAQVRFAGYLQAVRFALELQSRIDEHLEELHAVTGYRTANDPAARLRWVAWLLDRPDVRPERVLASLLVPPPPGVPAPPELPLAVRRRLIRTVGMSGRTDCVPPLVEALTEMADAGPIVETLDALDRLGLPQPPRPGTPADDAGSQPVSPGLLAGLIAELPPELLSPADSKRAAELAVAFKFRAEKGLPSDALRWGKLEVRPGDWMLVRNPAPYNRFTTLSPGLFTHVGVVAAEVGPDGRSRIVVTEMRERGRTVPATNFDLYLQDVSHYAVLRHEDPLAAAAMGKAAARLIGRPAQFDLDFRTDRVAEHTAEGPLRTYCAGFLLLCAQAAGRPREECFPVLEEIVGPRTIPNLDRLGMRLRTGFISPTGPFFAVRMRLVGWKEPRFDPGREVEEAVYDHFAARLTRVPLEPHHDSLQALRLRVAEAARGNPLLAQALATAANVDADVDLVRGAKALAAIETIDEVVLEAGRGFRDALAVVTGQRLAGNLPRTPAQEAAVRTEMQTRHADLIAARQAGTAHLRTIRTSLAEHYVRRGKRQLDERFFPSAE